MARNTELGKEVPPERDPLEIAILSFSSMEPADVGSDIAGNELARIKGYNTQLPETDLTATEWQIVMSEYISKGLDPNADSTRMLKYFDRQLKQAFVKEKQKLPASQQVSGAGVDIPLHHAPFAVSLAGMLAGVAITGFTFINEDLKVDALYPGYSHTELSKRSKEYQQYGPTIVEWWNEELQKISTKRQTALNNRLDQNPTHNIGKKSFWAGLAGTVGFGGISLVSGLIRRRNQQ